MSEDPQTFYDAVGGAATFHTIVSRFYALVRDDEVLRPLYPDDELDAAEDRLRMFLEQDWGGPRTYEAERGHPRLRMRHAPFAIDAAARDRWLELMRGARSGDLELLGTHAPGSHPAHSPHCAWC